MITVYETRDAIYIVRTGKVTKVTLDKEKASMLRLLAHLALKERIRYVCQMRPTSDQFTEIV